jgi:glycosyltransferase involved in cell wall biosynthesis
MRVLIVNSYFDKGGAAKAAFRIASSLKKIGVDVRFHAVYGSSGGFLSKILYFARVAYDRLVPILLARKKIMFSTEGFSNKKLVDTINRSGCDLVNIHWVNAGALSLSDLADIKLPIVFTLHDNWLYTGGCHVMSNCRRYEIACGRCPMLESTRESDLSRRFFYKKYNYLAGKKNVGAIAVSNWVKETSERSPIFNNVKIKTIQNPVFPDVFYPVSKDLSRESLGIFDAKKNILFGGSSVLTDSNKGFRFLVEALGFLDCFDKYRLVIFGDNVPLGIDLPVETVCLGRIKSESQLRLIYSAVDVSVVPSIQESFGQVAAESMACGTPVVAFNTTGLKDIVDHLVNGYLAYPFSSSDFATGINWVLDNEFYSELSGNSIEKIRRCFSPAELAATTVEFYKEVVGAWRNG